MDRTQTIGFIFIAVIFIVYMFYMQPDEEQIKEMERERDSIVRAENLKKQLEAAQSMDRSVNTTTIDTVQNNIFPVSGKTEIFFLENELIKLNIGTKGGRIQSVELKKFKTHDQKSLILWDEENSQFGLRFFAQNQTIYTKDLIFSSKQIDSETLSFKARAGEGYIEFLYHLSKDSYVVDFTVNLINLNKVISHNTRTIDLTWQSKLKGKEKGRSFENRYTNLYFKYLDSDVERISKKEMIDRPVKWVGYKQQFFSSVLISKNGFQDALLESANIDDDKNPYLKNFVSVMSLLYRASGNENYQMQFYLGPNHYLTLRKYGKDIELHRLINLGWWIFGWINRFLVIPIFNWLEVNVTQNYGVIILLLTLIIKILLFPLTYKSYISQAKMRVLKPQIDKITKKFPKEKMMERQRATMDLYKKAGVNPMGGCLPMFIQFPILYAMFMFFPASIELRQKGFLWAEDLSTYDSILSLPTSIPFYGDHVSLFCLLMAATNLIYTHFNMRLTSTSQQMPGMKMITYMMPIMFLVWFNNYSSGLSYYYFISTLITILQTFLIRKTINDEKVLARLEAKKKKPRKKSGFQARLEKMARERGYNASKRK